MQEVPKIIDEMQKVKDIVTNYILFYKLADDQKADKSYNQLNSIFCTATNIQKISAKKIIDDFNYDLDILLNRAIRKKYNTKNLLINMQLSSDEISISFLGKKLFYKKDGNFYLVVESLLQEQDTIRQSFSNYIDDISLKISNYFNELNSDKDIKYTISFAKNYNINAHEISIIGSYENNDYLKLTKSIDDFIQSPISNLISETIIIPISKSQIDKQNEINTELKLLNSKLSKLEKANGDINKLKNLNKKLDLLIKEYGGNI